MNGLLTGPGGLLDEASLGGFIDEADIRSASELISPRRGIRATFASPNRCSTPNASPMGGQAFGQTQDCGGGSYSHQSRLQDQVFRQGILIQCHSGPSHQIPQVKGKVLTQTPNRSSHSGSIPERLHASPTLASAICSTEDGCSPELVHHSPTPPAQCGMPVLEDGAVARLPMKPHSGCDTARLPLETTSGIEHHSPIPILQPPRAPHPHGNESELEGIAEPGALSLNYGVEGEQDNAQVTPPLPHCQPTPQPVLGVTSLPQNAVRSSPGYRVFNQNIQAQPRVNGAGGIAEDGELALVPVDLNGMNQAPHPRSSIPDSRTCEALSAVLDTLTASLNDDGTLPYSTFEKIVQELSGIDCLQSMLLFRPNKKKGKGGRQPAKDPRLDPNICPRKAKRIVANRQSAARSKRKQKQYLESLQLQHDILTIQTLLRQKEKEKLEKETTSLTKDVDMLELEIQALTDHMGQVDSFISCLLQERDRLRVQMRLMAAAAISLNSC